MDFLEVYFILANFMIVFIYLVNSLEKKNSEFISYLRDEIEYFRDIREQQDNAYGEIVSDLIDGADCESDCDDPDDDNTSRHSDDSDHSEHSEHSSHDSDYSDHSEHSEHSDTSSQDSENSEEDGQDKEKLPAKKRKLTQTEEEIKTTTDVGHDFDDLPPLVEDTDEKIKKNL